MKTLLLVDGSSYLYRAFHALPDLRNQKNQPTGAIHGVLNMLGRLRKDYQADYSVCVFDAKGKTFRDDIYPAYKANRPPMPADLVAQIEPLNDCIRAMGWPILVIDGVEADDVIGTLVSQAKSEKINSIISTGDKDITQLVDEHVTLVNTMNNELLDKVGVTKKFGVPPEMILDYLTLIGDKSDNIPGVDKVGPKTAIKWLMQYGSLDNIVAHAGEIKGVVGNNLRNAVGWFGVARQLLTIKCNVELPVVVGDLKFKPQDNEKLEALYRQFDMRSALQDLQQTSEKPKEATNVNKLGETVDADAANKPMPYVTILTESELDQWLAQLAAAAVISIDTETTSLNALEAKLVGISFCIETSQAVYLPLTHDYIGVPHQLAINDVLKKLKPWLEDPVKLKLGQNLKYDKHVLANHGVKLNGIAHDTMLQSYVLESHHRHNMDSLALRHLEVKTISYEEIAGKGASRIGFEQVDLDQATQYAAEDADIALQLHHRLYPKIKCDPQLHDIYKRLELPVLDVLFEMERNGVLIDSSLLNNQSLTLGKKLVDLEQAAYDIAQRSFNLNSPKQIQDILFTQLKLPIIKKTPKGAPSTNEEVLQQLSLDYPLPKILLEYRGLAKLKSTYTDKLPSMVNAQTGRVHTNYAQAVAITGRLACSDPNLQNIPVRTTEGRRIREAFIAPANCSIISADYSQIELRIMAHLSHDAGLLKAFTANEDVHAATAAEIFSTPLAKINQEQRRYAKVINFGLIYGMSEFGLANQLRIERGAARAYMDRYFARYPGVADYMQRTRENAKANGYVETVLGRRLWLSEINSSNSNRRLGAERAAINAPMQGTAADIIKLAMIAVQKWLVQEKLQSKLIMQVHDELVLEVTDCELEIVRIRLKELMESVIALNVPLKVEVGVGKNWEQAH